MAEQIRFKLAHEGTTHRFCSTLRETALLSAVRSHVAKCLNKEVFELFWNDDESDVVLDTVGDLSTAIDFARCTRKRPTATPCIRLAVYVQPAAAPAPAAVVVEKPVDIPVKTSPPAVVYRDFFAPQPATKAVKTFTWGTGSVVDKPVFKNKKTTSPPVAYKDSVATKPTAFTVKTSTSSSTSGGCVNYLDSVLQILEPKKQEEYKMDIASPSMKQVEEQLAKLNLGSAAEISPEELRVAAKQQSSSSSQAANKAQLMQFFSPAAQLQLQGVKMSSQHMAPAQVKPLKLRDQAAEVVMQQKKITAFLKPKEEVMSEKLAEKVAEVAAKEKELKIREKALQMKEEVFEAHVAAFQVRMDEMEKKFASLSKRVENIEEKADTTVLESRLAEMDERLKKIEKVDEVEEEAEEVEDDEDEEDYEKADEQEEDEEEDEDSDLEIID